MDNYTKCYPDLELDSCMIQMRANMRATRAGETRGRRALGLCVVLASAALTIAVLTVVLVRLAQWVGGAQ